jgi:hypothetical protein
MILLFPFDGVGVVGSEDMAAKKNAIGVPKGRQRLPQRKRILEWK